MRFHIHVDAQELDAGLEAYLRDELGFWRSDFAGHPEGEEGFEPPHHWTLKTDAGEEALAVFEKLRTRAGEPGSMTGYLEGEYVASDRDISYRPFDPEVPIPFRLSRRTLAPGSFRESEVHITLSRDGSDPRLAAALKAMGFFAAYLPKSYGMAQVFTAQGTRQQASEVQDAITRYLEAAGGAAECSVKEERIVRWWATDREVRLPPVIDRITNGGSGA